MTYTISAFSSRQPVPPLRYSALRPAATIKVEAVKCCWEIFVRCCRLHRVKLWLVMPWQMGVRHGVVLQRKCGSAVLACAAQQSLWHCMEACHALGCLGSARREPSGQVKTNLATPASRRCRAALTLTGRPRLQSAKVRLSILPKGLFS